MAGVEQAAGMAWGPGGATLRSTGTYWEHEDRLRPDEDVRVRTYLITHLLLGGDILLFTTGLLKGTGSLHDIIAFIRVF